MCFRYYHFFIFYQLIHQTYVNASPASLTKDLCIEALLVELEVIRLVGAVTQWYSQRTSVLEVAGSIPTPVIVES